MCSGGSTGNLTYGVDRTSCCARCKTRRSRSEILADRFGSSCLSGKACLWSIPCCIGKMPVVAESLACASLAILRFCEGENENGNSSFIAGIAVAYQKPRRATRIDTTTTNHQLVRLHTSDLKEDAITTRAARKSQQDAASTAQTPLRGCQSRWSRASRSRSRSPTLVRQDPTQTRQSSSAVSR